MDRRIRRRLDANSIWPDATAPVARYLPGQAGPLRRSAARRNGVPARKAGSGSSAAGWSRNRHPAIVRFALLPLLVIFVFSSLARAEISDDRTFRLQFAPGASSAVVANAIIGRGAASYRIAASAGQEMRVDLLSTNTAAYFNIYAPGRGPGDAALVRSEITGPDVPRINSARVTLPQTGDYTVQVFLNRNAARRGEVAVFTLSVGVVGKAGGQATQLPEPPGTGAADPRYWRVSGLPAGDRLNVRSGPSTANSVIGSLRQGEVVQNLGCTTNSSGSVWCRVSATSGTAPTGWASARYLVASQTASSGSATQLPGATPLPPDRFNASGRLACTIDTQVSQCPWGVVRRSGGRSTLVVTLPRGDERRIEFEGEIPVSANRSGGVLGTYLPNGMIDLTVGANERYQLAISAITGG